MSEMPDVSIKKQGAIRQSWTIRTLIKSHQKLIPRHFGVSWKARCRIASRHSARVRIEFHRRVIIEDIRHSSRQDSRIEVLSEHSDLGH